MISNSSMRSLFLLLSSLLLLPISAQKKALSHEDFDSWKGVRNQAITRSGEWAAYAVNPQEGDGILYFYNTRNRKQIAIDRGYNATFSADGLWGFALIKPLFADSRKAKIDKRKDFDMPQDSLAVINLKSLKVEKIANVIDFKIAKDGGNWVAFKSCDTLYISPKDLKDKDAGKPLVVLNPGNGSRKLLKWVQNYAFSNNGENLALTVKKNKKDSVTTDGVGVLFLKDTTYTILDRDKRFYGMPVFSEDGLKLAFTASDDSVATGTKRTDVYLSDLRDALKSPVKIPLLFKGKNDEELMPNQFTELKFSHNGKRLIAGVAPVVAPDDTTIVDFEHGKLDIWVWNKAMNPPMEKHELENIRKNNYPVAINLENMQSVLLTDELFSKVISPNRWDGNFALVCDESKTMVSHQWDYFAPTEMRIVNLDNGKTVDVGEYLLSFEPELSPADKYVAYFRDRNYFVYDITSGKTVNVSEKIPYPMWDTEDRHPSPAENYGIAGWSENDAALLLYDKYDIWSVDPKGESEPVCITDGDGRRRDLRYRYLNTDAERRFLKEGDQMLLTVFDYKNKYNGLATMIYGKPRVPAVSALDKHMYSQILQARDAKVYTWQCSNFSTSPEIWLSVGNDFAKARQLTDANPQMKDYRWGTAQLVKWHAYDGSESEGVLYVPDDIDPNQKYPMLCVFYETGSEELYRHYTMEPSWSWVNYPFYVSRGYVIFVPDIHYNSGRPGEDAYNYVCSGAEEMCRRYPWIDKDRIGIDGQSWGGYQTAYLVTRTNMFACAGSGAPVANMTSAYGGIRWESGDSRQAQYEQGQSRIGGTLWEKTHQYIANSPVFFADRVNTPLLIMHNDNDGAVPWYQGIELFMALRRLEKPVWMLQYNGEAHNIRDRKNRKDITRRLQQFFDHYLKGDPMPKWMKEGVPMIRKGQEWGFEYD